MNYGPIIFLAAFLALATSWFGMVLKPTEQLGTMQQTNTVPGGALYPLGRPGLARQGAEIYRANGCAYCHSQQVGQEGSLARLVLSDLGTNQAAALRAVSAAAELSESDSRQLGSGLPRDLFTTRDKERADAAAKAINGAGAKATVWVVPIGPDETWGWGKRRSVAEDYLYEAPPMPGVLRVGPDLANVGVRLPDPNWHLRHLYAPNAVVPKSPMPPYRFLFEKRRLKGQRSPEALAVPVETGYEVIPTADARALVAYVLSLRQDEPLFDAPFTAPEPAPASTNAPGTTATNATTSATATNGPAAATAANPPAKQ
jgi:cbb3-type cytochrome oxidase cytochrome c subunit